MAIVFLIRHGLTAQTGRILYGRTPGISLDERGRAQAADLLTRFAGVRLTAVYSSPLDRCVETVAPLAAANRLPVRTSEAIIEMDAGSWTGKPLSRLRRTKGWEVVQAQPSAFRFPGGGEGFAEARERAVAEVERIARRHRRGRVAIGTHGDIARLVLAHYSGIPLDGFQRVIVDTASVSVLMLDGSRPHVLLMNDVGGLARFGEAAHPWEATGQDTPRPKVRG